MFPNSRRETSAKTVASEIGDVELACPETGTGCSPRCWYPKGARRLDGLDAMIVSANMLAG